jgi:surface antigen
MSASVEIDLPANDNLAETLMARRSVTILILSMLLLAALPASAFWAWMRGAALNEFTDDDWDMLKTEARRVLDEDPDGSRTDWTNPETGNGGSIKPLKTLTVDGQTCRQTAFRQVSATGLKGQGVYHLCRQDDGTWRFIAASSVKNEG